MGLLAIGQIVHILYNNKVLYIIEINPIKLNRKVEFYHFKTRYFVLVVF